MMRIRKRLMTLASIVLAATLGLGATGEAADPVRIGFSIAKTGLFASAAPSQLNAYELWKDQVNTRGGLNVAGTRRPIEFVVYDDQSEPAQAVKIYEKLITQDKVDLLLAPWSTVHHFAIAAVLERYKFPMVGNTAASVKLREIKPGYIWFVAMLQDTFAPAFVKLMKAQNVKTAAVATLQLPFSLELKQYLVPEMEKAGIKVVVNQEYPPTVRDMTAMLTAIKAAKPDALLSLSYPEDSVLHINQARQLGVHAPVHFLAIGPTIDFFAKMFGPAAEGILTYGGWSPHQAKWPRAKPFYEAYVKKFNIRPDYLDSIMTQMSVEVLEQAVAKAGLDKEKLRRTISEGTFETVSGPVRFKGVENVAMPAMVMQLQAGGEGQIVWPAEFATKPFMPKPGWPK